MPFESIGKRVKELRVERRISLKSAADEVGMPAPNLCDIEAGRRYVGPHASGLASVLGGEIFLLTVREAELRGLRPAAEIAVEIVIARDAPVVFVVCDPRSPEGRAELERRWREEMLNRDVAGVLTEEAVLAELDKHWSRPAMKAGYAGQPELTEDELKIVRDVIGKAIAEHTALQQKIREASD